MTKHPKRPRDLNQWAKRMVDIATGEVDETDDDEAKAMSPAGRGKLGGKKGGVARAQKLSAEERKTPLR